MRLPPLTRQEFEQKTRHILAQDGKISQAEFDKWSAGRDWLARRLVGDDAKPGRRRYPRAKVSLAAHIAGVGGAVTDDIGFRGLALRASRLPKLRSGEEQSVRVNIEGRSIYATATVVWADSSRIGLAISAIHPDDEAVLQAAVCVQHLDRWIDP